MIAIHGLGRIGRLALRRLARVPGLPLAAVNELADARTLVHLLKHDTVHGPCPFSVAFEEGALLLDGRRVPLLREADPERLPFGALGARVVLDCTGRCADRASAARHLRNGVTRVLVSAPLPDADATLAPGVNDEAFDPSRHTVLSAGSGTTQALAPVAKVLDESFGIAHALVTAVHAYTNDQNILDLPNRTLRYARAATLSMIPAPSRAPEALPRVLPGLEGRLSGGAVRVPTPDVSLLDLGALLKRSATAEDVNAALRAAAEGPLRGYLEVLDEELVSADLVGREASSLVDPFLTRVSGGRLAKVYAWYDNEAAYAARLAELALRILEAAR